MQIEIRRVLYARFRCGRSSFVSASGKSDAVHIGFGSACLGKRDNFYIRGVR